MPDNTRSPSEPLSTGKDARRHVLPHSTPFPNFFLDKVMPVVLPTRWTVLCFIWRKTIGWGKDCDAVSLSQFVRGTGLKKDTVIKALAFWENVGLVGRLSRSGFRGINLYRVSVDYDRDVVASKVGQPAEKIDQSSSSSATGRKIRSLPVHPTDTQKAPTHKARETKATLSRPFHRNEKRSDIEMYRIEDEVYVR